VSAESQDAGAFLKRRDFIASLGAAAVWPLPLSAQQPGRLPTVGFLGTTSRASWSSWTGAFVERLRELGWIEGRTVAIEYRWAEARVQRYDEIAAEFVRLKVDVIVTSAGAVPAAMKATSTIPIVFTLAPDPVSSGFVASLARPGGNVTGLSTQANDLAAKRLEILREVIPGLRRVAIMANAGHPNAAQETREIAAPARAFGVELVASEIRRSQDIAPAFDALKGRADAVIVVADPLTTTNRVPIVTLALAARLPTMHTIRENVDAGGLISYGTQQTDLFRRAGEYVDRILRGAKPANIPVEQPTKFELVINLTTAKALGLTVPPNILARANEVIE
jgi:putative ABC transport system substrate-binding protein